MPTSWRSWARSTSSWDPSIAERSEPLCAPTSPVRVLHPNCSDRCSVVQRTLSTSPWLGLPFSSPYRDSRSWVLPDESHLSRSHRRLSACLGLPSVWTNRGGSVAWLEPHGSTQATAHPNACCSCTDEHHHLSLRSVLAASAGAQLWLWSRWFARLSSNRLSPSTALLRRLLHHSAILRPLASAPTKRPLWGDRCRRRHAFLPALSLVPRILGREPRALWHRRGRHLPRLSR